MTTHLVRSAGIWNMRTGRREPLSTVCNAPAWQTRAFSVDRRHVNCTDCLNGDVE